MIPAPEITLPLLAAWCRDALQALAMVLYACCQLGLAMYSSHRFVVLQRKRTARPVPLPPECIEARLPVVTVQLPIYNELAVVERLIDAAAELQYPADRFEIQVLDDSTDGTTACAAAAIARHRARGVDIVLVRRGSRVGYKAGALANGLKLARGEYLAVFDADFVPTPDFLRRLLPYFADPRVGCVQARWGHLNRGQSLLTAAQAVMLDAHFLLEHAVRMSRGLFFNFNGTAGVWRSACIRDAGGWSHDTLTEDMDLSYRAQLRGWRFVFDADVVVPAELPSDMQAFKSQQHRWAKGSIQTARKLLPAVFASDLPLAVKVEAFFHLTSNAAYPMLLLLSLLLLPVMLGRSFLSPVAVWALQGLVILTGVLPVTLFLAGGQREAGSRGWALVRDTLAALSLGVGLSLNNARAVLEGLGSQVGVFERTPKTGEKCGAGEPAARSASATIRAAGRSELALACYFGALLLWAGLSSQWRALPFLGLLALAYTWVGWGSRLRPVR
ncbi:MAG: cellulose synthase family protein [Candidatus Eisenbacteria bacterium]